jgi:hypothetical protein
VVFKGNLQPSDGSPDVIVAVKEMRLKDDMTVINDFQHEVSIMRYTISNSLLY